MIIGFGCFHFFNRCFQPFDGQGVNPSTCDGLPDPKDLADQIRSRPGASR
jgi:hypothetical protein